MFTVLSAQRPYAKRVMQWLKGEGYDVEGAASLAEASWTNISLNFVVLAVEDVAELEAWSSLWEIEPARHVIVVIPGHDVSLLEMVYTLPTSLVLIEGEANVALKLKHFVKYVERLDVIALERQVLEQPLLTMMTQLKQLRRLLPMAALGVEVRRCLDDIVDSGQRLELLIKPNGSQDARAMATPLPLSFVNDANTLSEASSAPGKPSLLVIDDEPQMRRAMGRLLNAQYELHLASDGAEALALLEQGLAGKIDVILCDLMMPTLSGPEFYEQLKLRWPLLEPKVIFVTGGGVGAWVQSFEAHMRERILYKPLTRDTLVARIDQLVVSA